MLAGQEKHVCSTWPRSCLSLKEGQAQAGGQLLFGTEILGYLCGAAWKVLLQDCSCSTAWGASQKFKSRGMQELRQLEGFVLCLSHGSAHLSGRTPPRAERNRPWLPGRADTANPAAAALVLPSDLNSSLPCHSTALTTK